MFLINKRSFWENLWSDNLNKRIPIIHFLLNNSSDYSDRRNPIYNCRATSSPWLSSPDTRRGSPEDSRCRWSRISCGCCFDPRADVSRSPGDCTPVATGCCVPRPARSRCTPDRQQLFLKNYSSFWQVTVFVAFSTNVGSLKRKMSSVGLLMVDWR